MPESLSVFSSCINWSNKRYYLSLQTLTCSKNSISERLFSFFEARLVRLCEVIIFQIFGSSLLITDSGTHQVEQALLTQPRVPPGRNMALHFPSTPLTSCGCADTRRGKGLQPPGCISDCRMSEYKCAITTGFLLRKWHPKRSVTVSTAISV